MCLYQFVVSHKKIFHSDDYNSMKIQEEYWNYTFSALLWSKELHVSKKKKNKKKMGVLIWKQNVCTI